MNCPLKLVNPDCGTCPFVKESLCDFPYITGEHCKVGYFRIETDSDTPIIEGYSDWVKEP